MLEPFAEDIWIADGPIVATAGFRYPTRMALIRLDGGGLFVWSPTPLTPELKSEVDAVGPVRFLVAPNSLHHLFMGDWAQAYPDALMFAAPGLRPKRPDLAFHGELSDQPDEGWAQEMDQVVVRGNLITTEVVFFHRKSGTVIFTDLIQHFSPSWFTGWRKLVARLDLMTEPEGEVPRKFRLAFADRAAARASIRRIAQWPAQKVLMAHAEPVTVDASGFIARRFRWLGI
jgi:hypothetical protein